MDYNGQELKIILEAPIVVVFFRCRVYGVCLASCLGILPSCQVQNTERRQNMGMEAQTHLLLRFFNKRVDSGIPKL